MNLYGHSAQEAAKILGVKLSTVKNVERGRASEPKIWANKLIAASSPEARTGAPDPLPLQNDLKGAIGATAQPQTSVAHDSVGITDLQVGATGLITKAKPKDATIYPSPEPGHPEFNVLSDGFAQGWPGDSPNMRATHRTASALRRILEKKNNMIGCRFAGMGDLPPVYKIDSNGDPTDLNGKPIKFDTKPTVGTSAGK